MIPLPSTHSARIPSGTQSSNSSDVIGSHVPRVNGGSAIGWAKRDSFPQGCRRTEGGTTLLVVAFRALGAVEGDAADELRRGGADAVADRVQDVGIVLEELFGVFPALAEALVFQVEP